MKKSLVFSLFCALSLVAACDDDSGTGNNVNNTNNLNNINNTNNVNNTTPGDVDCAGHVVATDVE